MSATDTAIALAQTAARAASDKLATDIVLIDVSDRLAITDVFVIATGSNERQVEAIVDEVEEKLRLAGFKALRREGRRDGRWVLLDYSEIVVHIQHSEERVFYALERLWKDCPFIAFEDGPDARNPSAAVTPTEEVPTGDKPADDAAEDGPADDPEAR
jgi:ribosome-associated protein